MIIITKMLEHMESMICFSNKRPYRTHLQTLEVFRNGTIILLKDRIQKNNMIILSV